jgi:hypothetical protein
MPSPLVAKRMPALSPIGQALFIIFVCGPFFGLWYCWRHNLVIHLDNPGLNLAAHAGLIVLPLVWAGFMFHKPVVYEVAEGEKLIGKSSYFSRWPVNWWMMFMMWATPVFVAVALIHSFVFKYFNHPETLSTPALKALAIMLVMTALGCFYATILLGRADPAAWVSEEGLRTSVLRFHKWENFHHLSRHGDLYAFFHRVNPSLPANAFKVRDDEGRAALQHYLSKHNIPLGDGSNPAFSLVKIAVVLGFLFNLALSLWLRFNTRLSFLTITLLSFALGIVLTLLLERYRGVSKYGRYLPVIEPEEKGC